MQQFQNLLLQYEHLYGLIGYPLSHSFSKKYFTGKFEKEGITNTFYELFPLEKIEYFLPILKNHPNLRGINVTIPYKEAVITYLNKLDESARSVGAVNCIQIENGMLIGYNTDVFGFERSLLDFLAQRPIQPTRALVLGTGGAAKAVVFVLQKLGILFESVSREAGKGDLTYNQLDTLNDFSLIINTTPMGMSPHVETFPDIPYHCLNKQHLLFDLVYNPEQTLFLQKGAERGAATQNGLPMLYFQAEKAWEIWNNPTLTLQAELGTFRNHDLKNDG